MSERKYVLGSVGKKVPGTENVFRREIYVENFRFGTRSIRFHLIVSPFERDENFTSESRRREGGMLTWKSIFVLGNAFSTDLDCECLSCELARKELIQHADGLTCHNLPS